MVRFYNFFHSNLLKIAASRAACRIVPMVNICVQYKLEICPKWLDPQKWITSALSICFYNFDYLKHLIHTYFSLYMLHNILYFSNKFIEISFEKKQSKGDQTPVE
jgi:hypothetical protein